MVNIMREEYDIEKLNPRPNHYASKTKKPITINITSSTVDYFKGLSEKVGMPYQTLIDLYLTDCAKKEIKPEVIWNK